MVYLNLEAFFGRINHDRLEGRQARQGGDQWALRVISAYVQKGILEKSLIETPKIQVMKNERTRHVS